MKATTTRKGRNTFVKTSFQPQGRGQPFERSPRSGSTGSGGRDRVCGHRGGSGNPRYVQTTYTTAKKNFVTIKTGRKVTGGFKRDKWVRTQRITYSPQGSGSSKSARPVQAGRLKTYIQNWQVITQDPWILDVVSGRSIDWVETPKQNLVPKELKFNQETSLKVDLEI